MRMKRVREPVNAPLSTPDARLTSPYPHRQRTTASSELLPLPSIHPPMFHRLVKHPLLRLALSPKHLWRSIELGSKSIWLHKLRSLLTALGVVFGVASVVAMLAIG